MMLARNLDYKRLAFPVLVQEKFDGVPGDFYAKADGEISALTRQGEEILSVGHITGWLYGLLKPHHHLVGELHVTGLAFKDISGMVRAERPAPELVLRVFDYYIKGFENMTYEERLREMALNIGVHVEPRSPVQLIPGVMIHDENTLRDNIETFDRLYPNKEGVIIRNLNGTIDIGKRSWNLQRHKAVGTADLRLIGFEEAVEGDTKKPKGMVGRLLVEFNGQTIGCGPGCLRHSERIAMWNNPDAYLQRIIEVEYKPDPTYVALREPVFKRWRDDKTQPNIE